MEIELFHTPLSAYGNKSAQNKFLSKRSVVPRLKGT